MRDGWVTVATFTQSFEAHLARGRLEVHGIECELADEHIVNMLWLFANSPGGMRLSVRRADAAEAREILDSPGAPADDPSEPNRPPGDTGIAFSRGAPTRRSHPKPSPSRPHLELVVSREPAQEGPTRVRLSNTDVPGRAYCESCESFSVAPESLGRAVIRAVLNRLRGRFERWGLRAHRRWRCQRCGRSWPIDERPTTPMSLARKEAAPDDRTKQGQSFL